MVAEEKGAFLVCVGVCDYIEYNPTTFDAGCVKMKPTADDRVSGEAMKGERHLSASQCTDL